MFAVLALSFAMTANAQVSGAKVALFESDAFFHPKTGISTLIEAQKKLSAEMQPRLDELKKLSDQVEGLQNEIRIAVPAIAKPEWLREKNDQGSRILRELDFKKKDAEAYQEKRQKDLIEPQVMIITKEIFEFAKKRAIDVLIDQSRFSGSILPVNPSIDITNEFISAFNAKAASVPVK